MKRFLRILPLLLILTTFNSCYIVRYKKLKKDYDALRKEYLIENSKTIASRQKYLEKKDSVTLLVSQTENNIKSFKANNKLTDSLSKYIFTNLGTCWTETEKATCNTARDIKLLNKDEKEIFMYLGSAENLFST